MGMGEGDDHDPSCHWCMPEYLRVAEVRLAEIEHRVAVIMLEGAAAIMTEGEVLRLVLPRAVMGREQGGNRRRRTGAKAA